MSAVYLSMKNILKPQVLAAERDFLVVYKPPRMHSAPLAHSSSDNVLAWCSRQFPEIAELPGRRAGEGGLLHRLDFETHGLLLVARTRRAMETLILAQKNGDLIKEYSALASTGITFTQGFPREKPDVPPGFFAGEEINSKEIKSAFRAYGFGRKAVRPVIVNEGQGIDAKEIVLDGGNPYTTEICEACSLPRGIVSFRLRIYRGFRHQIRCHLAWLGFPILNDKLYGARSFGKGLLALRANSISLVVPSSGSRRTYAISPLEPDEI